MKDILSNPLYQKELENKLVGIPLYLRDGIHIARNNKEVFLENLKKYILNLANRLGIEIEINDIGDWFKFDEMTFSCHTSSFTNEVEQNIFMSSFDLNELFELFTAELETPTSYTKINFEVR